MYKVKLTNSHFKAQNDAEIRDITIGDLLKEISDTHPNSVAMVDVMDDGECGKSWNYSDLFKQSDLLAKALTTRFKAGEKVVVWAPNIPEWIFLEYACALSGLVLVTANPSFQAAELKYVIEQSGAVGLFLINEFRGNPMGDIAQEAMKGNTQIREVVNLENQESLYANKNQNTKLPEVKPEDAAQIQYTSGTTGFPKGAVLSHKNLLNNARLFCARKKVGPHSVWANFMPLFHTAGCATGALGCLQAACKMLLIKRYNADIFAKLIEQQGVTTCFAVPTMLFNLLESLESFPRNMSSLEVISTGGAPVPPDLVRRVKEKLGCHLLSAFGQTEHSPMICLNPIEATVEQIVETAGQPLPHTEVSIRSTNNNKVLPINEVGEICARSYAVMIGYNDNPKATNDAIDKEGWLHTGDLGKMDEQGFVRVTGRVKDMIIRGGENHFPAEIEAVLVTHADVNQVAVVGLPDEKWGEIIAAFILSDTTPKVDSLKSHCRTYLSPQKTPSIWVQVPNFPLTGSGKVQKFTIKDQYLGGNYGKVLNTSVRIEKKGPVWTIIHSRPEARNAIDPESAKAIYNAFNEFNKDKTAHVAVLWGEGGAFCSGWDLKYASTLSGSDALEPYNFPDAGEPPMAVMGISRLELSKPVIAAISGAAVAGGMEVAIWCDIRVMEETSYMGVYNRRWGIPLIDGGTVRLPRLIGEGRAMDLILTGRKVEADEALKIGLCEYVVPEGEARSKAETLAHTLAKFPQSSMLKDLKSVRSQHGLSIRDAMKQEWSGSKEEIIKGIKGALEFVNGKGRGGKFEEE